MFPEIHLSSSLVLPTYIVYLSLLFSLMILLLPSYAYRRSMSAPVALNISLILMVAGMIGARLMHVFFENFSFYREHWERIFYFWMGGFVFFGGALMAIPLGILYVKWLKLPVAPWLDFFAPIGAFGYGMGRFSCFFAGCCYGERTDLPWAIEGRHPTQLYAVAWELAVFVFLYRVQESDHERKPGSLFAIWLGLHGLGRMWMEAFRDDFRGAAMLGLSVSSWISIFLILGSLGYFILGKFRHAPSLE